MEPLSTLQSHRSDVSLFAAWVANQTCFAALFLSTLTYMMDDDAYNKLIADAATEMLTDICAIAEDEISHKTLRKIHALNVAALQDILEAATPLILSQADKPSDN